MHNGSTVKFFAIVSALFVVSACSSSSDSPDLSTKASLGDALFHDVNLSLERTQSCATCHSPDHAFIDNRLGDGRLQEPGKIVAVSLGDDGVSLGDRNAPTASYALFSPDFHHGSRSRQHKEQNQHRTYNGALGGQFLDGREPDLKGQAGGPPLNPVEMNMPDKASVVARLQENDDYIAAFKQHFGETIFEDTDAAYSAMAESIAKFEKTQPFAPFDSKYDRFLRGEYVMTFKELSGRSTFFSQFANCGICHQLHGQSDPINKFKETFTGYEYHNIGVPVNQRVRDANGVTAIDTGLHMFTGVETDKGKFKVSTLRNIAVTEPYMHNGVFRDLATVIEFYNHIFDRNNTSHQINPETKIAWGLPEVAENIADEVTSARITDMDDANGIANMVCFLRTLTDQRYEHLIEEKGISCANE